MHLADLFLKMIKGSITEEEREELEEAPYCRISPTCLPG